MKHRPARKPASFRSDPTTKSPSRTPPPSPPTDGGEPIGRRAPLTPVDTRPAFTSPGPEIRLFHAINGLELNCTNGAFLRARQERDDLVARGRDGTFRALLGVNPLRVKALEAEWLARLIAREGSAGEWIASGRRCIVRARGAMRRGGARILDDAVNPGARTHELEIAVLLDEAETVFGRVERDWRTGARLDASADALDRLAERLRVVRKKLVAALRLPPMHETPPSPKDASPQQNQGRPSRERPSAREQVAALLSESPTLRNWQIVEMTGLDKGTVSRARRRVVESINSAESLNTPRERPRAERAYDYRTGDSAFCMPDEEDGDE